MNSEPNHDTSWKSCAPGTLQAYGTTAKASYRRRVAMRAAGASMLVVLSIGLVIWSAERLSEPTEYFYGGVACSEVRAKYREFATGTLPGSVAVQIRAHLNECPSCPAAIQKMQEAQGKVAATLLPEHDLLQVQLSESVSVTRLEDSGDALPDLPIRLSLARAR